MCHTTKRKECMNSVYEAEKCLIAKILIKGFTENIFDITEDHFSNPVTRFAFINLLLLKNKKEINIITFLEIAKEDEIFGFEATEIIGWESYSMSNPAEIIRNEYRKRLLKLKAMELTENLDNKKTLTEIIESMLTIVSGEVSESISASTVEDMRLTEYNERIEIKKSGKKYIGDESGFEFLDKLTDGINKASYWVIAGASSSGKSAVMNNIMSKLISQDKAIELFTFEMIPEVYNTRLLSIMSGITYEKIDKGYDWTGQITEDEIVKVNDASLTLRHSKLKYHTNASLNNLTKQLILLKNSKCDYVCIDYLQNIDIDEGTREYEAYKILSKKLQQFAFHTKKKVILVSQLSNDNIKNFDTQDSQAKGSGDVKNQSTCFISISDYYDKKKREERIKDGLPRVMTIRLEKSQRGRTGSEEFYYEGSFYNYKVADREDIENYKSGDANLKKFNEL